MATSIFTTWSDLYDSMLDDLAAMNFTEKVYRIGGRPFKAHDLEGYGDVVGYGDM